MLAGSSSFSGCYLFKDVSIPPEVKTARVNYIENKARYINPQLSPQMSEKLRQKINNQTRLTLVQAEDAHYDISGYGERLFRHHIRYQPAAGRHQPFNRNRYHYLQK